METLIKAILRDPGEGYQRSKKPDTFWEGFRTLLYDRKCGKSFKDNRMNDC